jgi:hypothetical protein
VCDDAGERQSITGGGFLEQGNVIYAIEKVPREELFNLISIARSDYSEPTIT